MTTPLGRPTGNLLRAGWETALWFLGTILTLAVLNAPLFLGRVSPIWDADTWYAPHFILVADHARAGKLVTWSPWTDGGLPTFVDPETGALSPLTVLCGLIFGPSESGFRHYWFALWALAAAGMFVFSRALGAPRWAAYAIGLGYALSGPFCGNAEHTSWIYASALLPWITWRWDVMLRTGSLSAAVQAGALWGLCALGGYPGHAMGALLFLGLWALGRWASRMAAMRWGPIVLAVALGLAIAAPLYVGFAFEAAGFSDRADALARSRVLFENALSPDAALLSLLSPHIPTLKLDHPNLWPRTDVSSLSLFFGLVPLGLVLCAPAPRGSDQRRWRLALWLLALLAFGVACSATFPLRGWLYDLLPPFRYFRHSSLFRVFSVLALCVIATENAAALAGTPGGSVSRRHLGYALAYAVLVPMIYVCSLRWGLHLPAAPLAAVECAAVPALVGLALLAGRQWGIACRTVAVVIVAAVGLDSFCNLRLSAPTLYSRSPELRAHWDQLSRDHSPRLKMEAFRRERGSGERNDNLVTKQQNLYNASDMRSRFHLALREMPDAEDMVTGSNRIWYSPTTLQRLVSNTTLDGLRAHFAQQHTPGFMIHRSEWMLKPLAEEDPPVGEVLPDALPVAQAVPVRVLRYEPSRLVFEGAVPWDGWLFIGDRWARSWRAKVNGQPAEVYGANLVFRALHVPAGHFQVDMKYRPHYVWALAAGSWILTLVALAVTRRRRRQAQ
jgi:hypothetical protein